MDEEIKTQESAGEAQVVTEETGSQAHSDENPAAAEQEAQKRFNSSMAASRRQGEQAAVAAMNERIAAKGRVNPNTGRAIASVEDMEAYLDEMQLAEDTARAKKEGRSVEEVRSDREAITRGRSAMRAEREAQQRDTFYKQSLGEFSEAYPDVNVVTLLDDEAFKEFCGDRLSRVGLTELYAAWEKTAKILKGRDAAKKESKEARSSGSGAGSSTTNLSAKQKAELDEWNAAFPSKKMSEKEFLEMKG